ncbi:hypothetical protein P9057_07670 [Gallibacterium anatis]|uniref:Uncharacterized protein n=1 Tax=Gallibacterium anatis TaxID=750 RepID=A0A0A3A9Y9_9PAST|nr:hypothetical protein [Gallibacterium anatis]KGQ34508.1 hypothetical protein JP34_07135 [Gallibacterium anatis]KGQ40185.1 hypothetical protein JP35_03675 [Gallibacterium anatis]KGQ57472.1 hypothetical protein IE01_04520 [Gallibacterium anatis DSM 16844 = F 149]KGQ66138.1 hypothetical protein IO49_06530 [Gallibacterium anatis]MBP4132441.1 hypothetical protein [Gallibacterium anatis]
MAQIEDVKFSVTMDYSQADEISIHIVWDASDTFPQEKVEQLIEYMNRNLVLLFGFFKDKFRLYLEYNEVLLSFSVKMRFEFDDIGFSVKFLDKDNNDTGAEYLARCIMNDLLTGNETIEKLLEYLQEDDESKSVEEIVLQ